MSITLRKLHGCHNSSPPLNGLYAQDGWTSDGRKKEVFVENKFSRGCKYDLENDERKPRPSGRG